MIRDVEESIVVIYLIIDLIEAPDDKQVQQSSGNTDGNVCNRVFIIEKMILSLSSGDYIFQAKKKEEGGHYEGSEVH